MTIILNLYNFKINKESKHMISRPHESSQIVKFMEKIIGKNLSELIISDYTAGVGGDAINFSYYFKWVNAIEKNEKNFELLQENRTNHNRNNMTLYYGDCSKLFDKIDQNVIYIDPPWGGPSYKDKKYVKLKLGGMRLFNVLQILYTMCIKKNVPFIVFIKVPLNIYLEDIKKYFKIYVENIYNKKKYLSFKVIVVLEKNGKDFRRVEKARS